MFPEQLNPSVRSREVVVSAALVAMKMSFGSPAGTKSGGDV